MIMKDLILNGLKTVQIRHRNQVDLSSDLYKAIVSAVALTGQQEKFSANDAAAIAGALAADIRREFASLRSGELMTAFRMGVQGKLGEWYGLNYRTFYRWISEYFRCDDRMSVMRMISEQRIASRKQIAATATVTDEEKNKAHELIVRKLEDAYCRYRKTGTVPPMTSIEMMLYAQELVSMGHVQGIEITDADRDAAMNCMMARCATGMESYPVAAAIRREGTAHDKVRAKALKIARERTVTDVFRSLADRGCEHVAP